MLSIALKIVQNILQNNCRSEMPYTRMTEKWGEGRKKRGEPVKTQNGKYSN